MSSRNARAKGRQWYTCKGTELAFGEGTLGPACRQHPGQWAQPAGAGQRLWGKGGRNTSPPAAAARDLGPSDPAQLSAVWDLGDPTADTQPPRARPGHPGTRDWGVPGEVGSPRAQGQFSCTENHTEGFPYASWTHLKATSASPGAWPRPCPPSFSRKQPLSPTSITSRTKGRAPRRASRVALACESRCWLGLWKQEVTTGLLAPAFSLLTKSTHLLIVSFACQLFFPFSRLSVYCPFLLIRTITHAFLICYNEHDLLLKLIQQRGDPGWGRKEPLFNACMTLPQNSWWLRQ